MKVLVAVVEMAKLVELLPAATVTVGGTWRSAGLLLSQGHGLRRRRAPW